MDVSDPIRQIAMSSGDVYALLEDGTLLYAMGSNDGPNLTPVDDAAWSTASTEGGHRCAISTEGLMTCWGVNGDGQCDVPQ